MPRTTETVADVRRRLAEESSKTPTGDDTPNPKYQARLNANLGNTTESAQNDTAGQEATQRGSTVDSTATASNAPWEGYDGLSVAEINERTATMNDDERATVRTYEQANKRRKGILDALA